MVTLWDMRPLRWCALLPSFALLACGQIIGIDPVSLRDAGDAALDDGLVEDTALPKDTAPPPDLGPPVPDTCSEADDPLDTYQKTVLADRPIGYWPLDDPPGSIKARDVNEVATRHDADALSVMFGMPHEFGSQANFAAKLEGAGFLKLDRIFNFKTASFSVEFWIVPAVIEPDTWRFVFAKETNGSRTGYDFAFAAEGMGFGRWSANSQFGGASMAVSPFEVGKWFHVVARYDASKRTSSILVNGKETATGEDNSDFSGDVGNNAFFTWGSFSTAGGAPMGGALFDELVVYDHVLPCRRARAHLRAAGVIGGPP